MNCCSLCIGDRHIRRQTFPELSSESGTCSYCHSSNQPLLAPERLRDLFELVIGVYKRSDSGRTLVSLLSEDWAMFDQTVIGAADAGRLIADILGNTEFAEARFARPTENESDSIHRWATFREELMHHNRYFPTSDIDHDRLRSLLPHLLLAPDEIDAVWWRVRLQEADTAIPIDKMGAPPASKASHGRANPAGIPYLYLASNQTTAISEVRPHTGELVTVAEFTVSNGLAIVDLATPRRTVSPFALEDEGRIEQLRADIGFLEQLGEELSRPVLPKGAAVAYTPSQYLCEFIKKCSYDGVRYASSVADGTNLALFQPGSAHAVSAGSHRVTQISVRHETVV